MARLLLSAGGILLALAPFCPYTYIPIASYQLPLFGIFLTGGVLIILGLLLLIQAAIGRGSVFFSWANIVAATALLWRDSYICTHDVGLALGRAQLSLQGVNRYLISLGFPPLHLIESQDIHRPLEIGVYLAGWGIALALAGSMLWLKARGRRSLSLGSARCSCGQALHDSFRFCPQCGRSLAGDNKRCHQCGASQEEGWQYCVNCGIERLGPKSP